MPIDNHDTNRQFAQIILDAVNKNVVRNHLLKLFNQYAIKAYDGIERNGYLFSRKMALLYIDDNIHALNYINQVVNQYMKTEYQYLMRWQTMLTQNQDIWERLVDVKLTVGGYNAEYKLIHEAIKSMFILLTYEQYPHNKPLSINKLLQLNNQTSFEYIKAVIYQATGIQEALLKTQLNQFK